MTAAAGLMLITLMMPFGQADAVAIYQYGQRLIIRIYIPFGVIDPVDEVEVYSDMVGVDTGFTALVTGDAGIGTWTHDYVTVDHSNDAFLYDAISFSLTSGDGVSAGETAEFEFKPAASVAGSCSNAVVTSFRVNYHDTAGDVWTDDVTPECIPEPPVIALLLLGAIGVGQLGRRRA